jgi:hypothetical protein
VAVPDAQPEVAAAVVVTEPDALPEVAAVAEPDAQPEAVVVVAAVAEPDALPEAVGVVAEQSGLRQPEPSVESAEATAVRPWFRGRSASAQAQATLSA